MGKLLYSAPPFAAFNLTTHTAYSAKAERTNKQLMLQIGMSDELNITFIYMCFPHELLMNCTFLVCYW